MDVDEAIVDRIRDRFASRGMTMPDINRRQAMVPRGATVLANANGTAPGLWLDSGHAGILLLPGPPREMVPMLEAVIDERLALRSGGAGLFRRVLKITGRAESDVDAQVAPIYKKWIALPRPISTTILAVLGQIELHLTVQATSRSEADAVLEPAVRELQDLLGHGRTSMDVPVARGGRRPAAARPCDDDRDGRIVHRWIADVAADRRSGKLRVRGTWRRLLQQSLENRAGRRARRIDSRTRCRERAGCASHGRRDSQPRRDEHRRRYHRHCRPRTAARRTNRSAPSRSPLPWRRNRVFGLSDSSAAVKW